MIWVKCQLSCSEKNQYVCREELRAHELVEERGEEFLVECGNCGNREFIPASEWRGFVGLDIREASLRRRAGLTKYPRIEPQSGRVVNSREDEKRVWKELGYHEAPHGVDESTFTETDYRIKERYQKREPSWRNLRRFA